MSKTNTNTLHDPNLYFGYDTFILPNKDVYVGEYCAHRYGLVWREGKGRYITKEGQIYDGYWTDDKLIEETKLHIKFPTGEEFDGFAVQNKYSGAGTYVMENTMGINCEFANNKPVGNIVLIDVKGHVWEGQAGENSALLLPENHFYTNIPGNLGIGRLKSKFKQQKEIEHDVSKHVNYGAVSALFDRELEKHIFAKSKKTLNDVDFFDSKWYQRYLRYRTMKDRITEKLKHWHSDDDDAEGFTKEENKWYRKFLKHKKKLIEHLLNRNQKYMDKVKGSEIDTSVLERFYSKAFKDSCPPMKVFHPTYNWLEESLEENETNEISEQAENI